MSVPSGSTSGFGQNQNQNHGGRPRATPRGYQGRPPRPQTRQTVMQGVAEVQKTMEPDGCWISRTYEATYEELPEAMRKRLQKDNEDRAKNLTERDPRADFIWQHFAGNDFPRNNITGPQHIDGFQSVVVVLDLEMENHYGSMELDKHGMRDSPIKVKYNRGTQTPSLDMILSRENGQRVNVRIGGECLVYRGTPKANLITYSPPGFTIPEMIPASLSNQRNIVHVLTLEVLNQSDGNNAEPVSIDELPRIMSIDPEELELLKNNHIEKATQHPIDTFIARLALGDYSNLYVLQTIPEVEAPSWNIAFSQFAAAMSTVTRESENWMLKTLAIDLSQKMSSELKSFWEGKEVKYWPPPNHLVTKWSLSVEIHKTRAIFRDFKPIKWNQYIKPSYGVSDRTRLIQMQTAILRDWYHEQQILLTSFCGAHSHRIEMRQNHADKSKFLVDFYVVENSDGVDRPKVIPPTGTGLQFVLNNELTKNKDVKFTGVIVDDLWRSEADCVLIVRTDYQDAFRFDNFEGLTTSVTIQSNQSTVTSQLLSLQIIGDGFRRCVGVDIKSLVLGCAPRIPINKQKGALNIPQGTIDRTKRDLVEIAKRSINEGQSALLDAVSKNAVTVVQGMGGTGKTETNAMCIITWLAAGKKCVVAASSNAAVEELFNRFSMLMEKMGIKKEVVFNRSKNRRAWDKHREGASDQNWDVDRGFNNKTVDSLAEHGLRTACIKWVTDGVATDELHPLCETAREWIRQDTAIKESPADIHVGEAKQIMQICMKGLLEAYVNRIDVVFSTFGCCQHPKLVGTFHPEVALCDEQSQTTAAELSTLLSAFGESIKSIVLAGDSKQLSPPCFSTGVNEWANVLEEAILETMEKQKQRFQQEGHVEYHTLTTQHRMQSQISDFPMRRFYKGMKDGPDVDNQDGISKFIAHFLDKNIKETTVYLASQRRFQKRWNRSARLAFDVSEPKSQKYKDSKSTWHEDEAAAAVAIAMKLLKHRCEVPGAKTYLDPSDIALLTFHTGQKITMRIMVNDIWALKNRDRLLPGDIEIVGNNISGGPNANSIVEFQGKEAPIVILSFAKNNAKDVSKLRFISKSENLALSLTRPRHALFMLGNFATWVEQADKLKRHNYGNLASLALDCHEKEDIFPLNAIVQDHELNVYKALNGSATFSGPHQGS